MRSAALTIAAALAATLAPASPAIAGTFTLEYCTQTQPNPPGNGSGWSSHVAGGAVNPAAAPTAWQNACTHHRAGSFYWQGTGGHFGDTAHAGGYALLRFTPPPGTTIAGVRSSKELSISSGSCGIAGLWSTAGRWFGAQSDLQRFLVDCEGDYDALFDVWLDEDTLGADGRQGIEFGARCPASLPPSAGGYCGGAGIALSGLVITVRDPSDAALQVTPTVTDDGRVRVAWAASDPQSGISAVQVQSGDFWPTEYRSYSCGGAAAYPPCQTSAGGEVTFGEGAGRRLAPGQSVTLTVQATQGRDNGQYGAFAGLTAWTGTVTRPADVVPQPTTPPPTPDPTPPGPGPGPEPDPPRPPGPTPQVAKVTLKAKVQRGRKLALSGTARGCSKVQVRTPGRKRSQSVRVRRGKWSVKVARKKGVYRVKCGKATAKRTWR